MLNDNTLIVWQSGGDPVTKPDAWKNVGEAWWGEPVVGYYLSDDAWVARRDLRMLGEAGVDVMIFDVTNAPMYPHAYELFQPNSELSKTCGSLFQTPPLSFR